jgi:hypothetical protein
MERLYREGEVDTETLTVGDILELYTGVFIRIKEIENITIEDFAGIKKTSIRVKSEIISNGKQ